MYNGFLDLQQLAVKDRKDIAMPYLLEYFNLKFLFKTEDLQNELAVLHTINALLDQLNSKDARLPKYLIVIMDHNLIEDLDVSDEDIHKIIPQVVNWFVCQINTILRCKRIDLLEKKPGTVAGCLTKVIYVCMIRRIGRFNPKITAVHDLQAKYNDALNNSVAKVQEHMLTINTCNMYEHFNKGGALSESGKWLFFNKLDSLIQKFDLDKIKLQPAPQHNHKRFNNVWSRKSTGFQHHQNSSSHWQHSSTSYRPPREDYDSYYNVGYATQHHTDAHQSSSYNR